MTPQAMPLYNYRAALVRVIDGDTVDVVLDCGMHVTRTERLRLLGVNAPEVTKAATREAGNAATVFVRDWLAAHRNEADPADAWPFRVHTEKGDSFGRYLATIDCRQGHRLNDALVESGHAMPFMVGAP